jgi:transcription initiation factor IIE alpha subunit
MSGYETILAVKKYWEDNDKVTIEEVNDLIYQIQNDPSKLAYELSNELEEYYSSKNVCPLCGEELETKTWEENRGEYFGSKAIETMGKTMCSSGSCSYIRD